MTTDRALIMALKDRATIKRNEYLYHVRSTNKAAGMKDKLVNRIIGSFDANNILILNGTIDILNNDLFEIYVCNPEDIHNGVYAGNKAGDITGWDIKWVLAPNREAVKQYPLFDCIISKNDNSTGRALTAELFIP